MIKANAQKAYRIIRSKAANEVASLSAITAPREISPEIKFHLITKKAVSLFIITVQQAKSQITQSLIPEKTVNIQIWPV